MRDLFFFVFDRGLPIVCFIGGAWFHRSIVRANAEIDRALKTVRHD